MPLHHFHNTRKNLNCYLPAKKNPKQHTAVMDGMRWIDGWRGRKIPDPSHWGTQQPPQSTKNSRPHSIETITYPIHGATSRQMQRKQPLAGGGPQSDKGQEVPWPSRRPPNLAWDGPRFTWPHWLEVRYWIKGATKIKTKIR